MQELKVSKIIFQTQLKILYDIQWIAKKAGYTLHNFLGLPRVFQCSPWLQKMFFNQAKYCQNDMEAQYTQKLMQKPE